MTTTTQHATSGLIASNIAAAITAVIEKARAKDNGVNLEGFKVFVDNANINILNTQSKKLSTYAKVEFDVLFDTKIKKDGEFAEPHKKGVRYGNIDIYPHAVASFKQFVLMSITLYAQWKAKTNNTKIGKYNAESVSFFKKFNIDASVRKNGQLENFTPNNDSIVSFFTPLRDTIKSVISHIDAKQALEKLTKEKKPSKGLLWKLPKAEVLSTLTPEQRLDLLKACNECIALIGSMDAEDTEISEVA